MTMKVLQQRISENHESAMFYDGVIATNGKYKLETFQSGEIVFNNKYYIGKEITKLIEDINDSDIDKDVVDIRVDKFIVITKNNEPVDEDNLIYDNYSEALESFIKYFN